MEIYPVEISPVNVNDNVNNTQDMEGVKYINVDKENSDNLISIYLYPLNNLCHVFFIYIN